jgi:hypothetical protein
MGLSSVIVLVSGFWIRCRSDLELVSISIEAAHDTASFVHPNLTPVQGVWIEGADMYEKIAVVEGGGLVIECDPRVLEVGGGRVPDVLNYGATPKDNVKALEVA